MSDNHWTQEEREAFALLVEGAVPRAPLGDTRPGPVGPRTRISQHLCLYQLHWDGHHYWYELFKYQPTPPYPKLLEKHGFLWESEAIADAIAEAARLCPTRQSS